MNEERNKIKTIAERWGYESKRFLFGNSYPYVKLIGIVIGTSILMSHCEDFLEEEAFTTFIGDSFFEDVGSAELAMVGVYNTLSSNDLYASNYVIAFHTGTDIDRYYRQGVGNPSDLLANYEIQEFNKDIGRAWATLYQGISRANIAIDGITKLRDQAADEGSQTVQQYNHFLGDVYFLRAFFYFQLVKNWGDVPLRLTPNVSLDELAIERSPKEEVYQQIESDMLQAIELLPSASNVSNKGRINQGAAQGILTRIYLHWAGNPIQDETKYIKAVEQAWAVVNSGEHALNPVVEKPPIGAPFDHEFPEVFANYSYGNFDLKESMWEVHFSFVGNNAQNGSSIGTWFGVKQHTNSSYKRGTPRRYPLPTFYDSFEEGDSLRRDWSISQFEINARDQFVPTNNELGYGVGKFRRYLIPSPSTTNNVDKMNWPVIRYADVLLMLAEGIVEVLDNGGSLPSGVSLDTALESINQVRRRARIKNPLSPNDEIDLSGLDMDQLRTQIRKERAWELCFENVRRPDLIRWGTLVSTVRETGAQMQERGYDLQRIYRPSLFISPIHNQLPIPFAEEISQNPAVLNTDPSNNGYR
ncbi:MAG: RagB/SusD family nutrient uptake outer membrane protein [Flavobacteriaceae bacterium]|nr:RagB/SusD family nutrient uptake outer membrane protein [Flavobacteriaceae bacterium]